jgi:GR25 family glycosyltransferase involved in LPS biosynthesis
MGLESSFRGHKLITSLRDPIFEIEKFYGLDARNLSKEELLKYYCPEKTAILLRRQISPGEIGCAYSHNLIYQNMIKASISCALILEDDAMPLSMDKLISTMIEFQDNRKFREKPSVLQLGSKIFSIKQSKGLILPTKFPQYGTYAYMLNLPAARELFNPALRVYSTADWPLNAMNVKWFRTPSILVEDMSAISLISKERIEIFAQDQSYRTKYQQKIKRRMQLLTGVQIFNAHSKGMPWQLVLKWEFFFKPYRKINELFRLIFT